MAAWASAFTFSCSSSKKKVEPVPETKPVDHSAWVNATNSQLIKIPVEGFAYKVTTVPRQKWERWAELAAPAIKKILDEMPDGYVLEIKGHTDARGPEEPTGDKPGNNKISTDRARSVYNSLKKRGISSSKATYRGVGSSELKPGIDPKSPAQRRVTFAVVVR